MLWKDLYDNIEGSKVILTVRDNEDVWCNSWCKEKYFHFNPLPYLCIKSKFSSIKLLKNVFLHIKMCHFLHTLGMLYF